MKSIEEKKLLQWLEQLEREAKRNQKKYLLQQLTLKHTNNRPFNLSTSHQKNFFGGTGFLHHHFQSGGLSNFRNRQIRSSNSSAVIKTNYCFSGHSKSKNGKRLNKAEVISKAQANLNYITRDGANRDIDENLSMLYNRTGKMLENDEYSKFKSDLKEMDVAGFRRVVISPEENLTREEMKDLIAMSLKDFSRETGKDADFVFSIHTNTDHIHAHVLMVSEHFNDLRWSQNDLQHFKEIVSENTRVIIDERELVVDKTLREEIEKSRKQEQQQEIKEEKEKKCENSRSL